MTTLALMRTQANNYFVCVQCNTDQQFFKVDNKQLIHSIPSMPFDATVISTYPICSSQFSCQALYWTKALIEEQEKNIKKIAAALQIPIPENSTGISQNVIAWLQEKGAQYTQLDLSNLDLTMIPPQIKYFTNLEALDISGNQLRKLPFEFTLLPLRNLNISDNPFETLIDLSKLIKLEELQMDQIRLGTIPQWLQYVTASSISMRENLFQTLPDWWDEWQQGKSCDLTNCPVDNYL